MSEEDNPILVVIKDCSVCPWKSEHLDARIPDVCKCPLNKTHEPRLEDCPLMKNDILLAHLERIKDLPNDQRSDSESS